MRLETKNLSAIAACLNIGHIIVGFGMAWSIPMIPVLLDSKRTPLSEPISEVQASWVEYSLYFGTFAALITGIISNYIGRRYTLILGGLVNLLAYVILTWPANIAMIYAGRVLVGFGLTFIAIINIVYIGEIAPPNSRGIMLTSTGIFQVLGSLLVVSAGPFIKFNLVGCIAIVITLLHIGGSFYIPESPIYYAMKGKEDEARKVLERLRRAKHVETELSQILLYVEEKRETTKFFDIFAIKCNRKAFIMGSMLMKMQQMNGFAGVIIIATTFFHNSTTYSTIITFFISFCGTIVAPIFVERCGRKGLLIVSTAGCGFSMIVLSIYFYLEKIEHTSVSSIKWLPIVSLIVALFTYNIGLNVVPNAFAGEMFRPHLRTTGTALILTQGWIFSFLSATTTHSIMDRFGYLFFILFAIFNFLCILIIVYRVTETKGKSLMEIEKILER